MKTTLLWMVAAVLLALPATGAAADTQGDTAMMHETRVRIAFDGKEAVVVMFDNPLAAAFLAMLPMTATLEDYAGTEKIYYPPQKLDTKGGRNAEQERGDFCYYAPWGNIAIFYKGMGYGTSLYVLGRLESGKEALGAMDKNFTAKFEVIR